MRTILLYSFISKKKKALPSVFHVCHVYVIGEDEIRIKTLVDSQFLLSPTLIIHNHE